MRLSAPAPGNRISNTPKLTDRAARPQPKHQCRSFTTSVRVLDKVILWRIIPPLINSERAIMTQDVAPSLGPPPDIRKRMALVFGEENMQAMELAHLLRVVVQLMRNLSAESGRTTQLSPSRLRLLVHLLIAREYGYDSLAPSDLSRHLAVSRNTISALLNGLEEQGYIVRSLHPEDRRQFCVQITPAGMALVREAAPQHGALVTSMFEPLSAEERDQLMQIMARLADSLAERAAALGLHSPEFDVNLSPGSPEEKE